MCARQRAESLANVALVVPRTEAEGPGMRFAIWVQGCPLRCPHCCNPEMLPFEPRTPISPAELAAQAVAADVEGISLLGGEPFAQAEPLADLARRVQEQGLSVVTFSGYTLEELRRLALDAPGAADLLRYTDLLVDGRYDHERRTTTRRWVGSSNQVVHFLSERYTAADQRFAGDNHLEIRLSGGVITINGFPLEREVIDTGATPSPKK